MLLSRLTEVKQVLVNDTTIIFICDVTLDSAKCRLDFWFTNPERTLTVFCRERSFHFDFESPLLDTLLAKIANASGPSAHQKKKKTTTAGMTQKKSGSALKEDARMRCLAKTFAEEARWSGRQ